MKIERLKKSELVDYCKSIGIDTSKKDKNMLLDEIQNRVKQEIINSIETKSDLELLTSKIESLTEEYASNLKTKIEARKKEMLQDDNSHYLIYRVLGVSNQRGKLIDEYQNEGRFLYKYAGSFLEEAASICLKFKNVDGGRKLIPNNQGKSPKTFEIDFLDGNNAIEIKWKDATTDGNHTQKEHTRVKAIASQGFKPLRIMFYKPQREQAKNIQENLAIFYKGVNGEYYAGDDAWEYIQKYSGYDLKAILTTIADKRTPENEN